MRNYTHLTQEQRYQISAMKRIGNCPSQIAAEMGMHRATIGRECTESPGSAGIARSKRTRRPCNGVRRARIGAESCAIVEEKLRQDWSPERVSGWLRKRQGIRTTHEWIYQYVLADKRPGGELHTHLRCQKKRRKRYGKRDYRGKIPNRVSITIACNTWTCARKAG